MSVGVIIVAGGRGERLGGAVPKQLLPLAGRSLLQWSVAAFDAHPRVSTIVVVLPADLVANGASLLGNPATTCHVTAGGARRQDSVARGLASMPPGVAVVLVHDAARPLVDRALIDRVLDAAEARGAALPAVPVRDTVKRIDEISREVRETVPRAHLHLAQTPQGFRREVLEAAVRRGQQGSEATDEAMLAEQAGHTVVVVTGSEDNLKITTLDHLVAVRARVEVPPRVGTGYDLHRLVDGRPLLLAGVLIDEHRGPASHSDGDVLCHAVIDAMLGAAASGDIGRHFPNTDPRWKDAAGLDLLARTVDSLARLGWQLLGIDATVMLERPKLAPVIDEVRDALAAGAGLDSSRVNVKAKTNEGVDAVGRGEAIAAQAVVTVGPGGRL